MAEIVHDDPLACSEEVEVDEKTMAAIQRGIRAANEGRVVSSEIG